MLTLSISSGRPPTAGNAREVDVWRDGDGLELARAFTAGSRRWIDWPGVGVFELDASTRVNAWPARGVPAAVVTDTFARAVQPVLLQSLGYQALHASAVAKAGDVLVLCGVSGSGKSTCAYALRERGWRQIADDSVVFRIDGPSARAFPLPFTPRLRKPSAHHLNAANGSQPGASTTERLRIRRIFLLHQDPNRAPADPSVTPLPPAQAFCRVLAHAHCFDGSNRTETARVVTDYVSLVERAEVVALTYRPGLAQLPALLDAVTSRS